MQIINNGIKLIKNYLLVVESISFALRFLVLDDVGRGVGFAAASVEFSTIGSG